MKKTMKALAALTVLFAFVAFTNNTIQKKKLMLKIVKSNGKVKN